VNSISLIKLNYMESHKSPFAIPSYMRTNGLVLTLVFLLVVCTNVVYGQIQTICAGPIPAGWLKTNDAWSPTSCGNPTMITYNVWTIERYDNKPIGAIMTVCNQTVPSGWATINTSWNPLTCGHPTSNVKNVIQIKRLN
jgi:hypothetical protein